MYFCENCCCVFDEPGTLYETHGELPGRPAESFLRCPCCGDTDVRPVRECDVCGAPSPDVSSTLPLCAACRKDLRGRFEDLLRSYFAEDEIEWLNEMYETERFGMDDGEYCVR